MGGWLAAATIDLSRVVLPDSVTTLAEAANKLPPPIHLSVVERSGSNFVVWIGSGGLWAIPSGPPCYVFDSKGKLLIWTWQTGEGGNTDIYVSAAWKTKSLTVNEALVLCAQADVRRL
jgi:hypothetical protein